MFGSRGTQEFMIDVKGQTHRNLLLKHKLESSKCVVFEMHIEGKVFEWTAG